MKILPTTRATAAALTLLATGLGSTTAQAITIAPSAPCDTTLTDAGGNTWPISAAEAWVHKGEDLITLFGAGVVGQGIGRVSSTSVASAALPSLTAARSRFLRCPRSLQGLF